MVARLIDEVTVKETSFLRDRQQLGRIDWRLLLQGARAAGAERLRVWAAPCATGEEPYTLALLACEAFAPAEPPVTIFATDISGDAVARARAGVYEARAVRDVNSVQRHRFFRRKGRAARRGRPAALDGHLRPAQPDPGSVPTARRGRVPPDPVPQRPDLLQHRDRRAGARVTRAGADARRDAGARRRGRALPEREGSPPPSSCRRRRGREAPPRDRCAAPSDACPSRPCSRRPGTRSCPRVAAPRRGSAQRRGPLPSRAGSARARRPRRRPGLAAPGPRRRTPASDSRTSRSAARTRPSGNGRRPGGPTSRPSARFSPTSATTSSWGRSTSTT